MGTNYYFHQAVCEHCVRSDEPLHIGKSSAGWCFTLHVIPEKQILDLEDWKRIFQIPVSKIIDEFGRNVSVADMLSNITDRYWPYECQATTGVLRKNHAEPGPRGLLRHRIENGHCISHGAGTWDCVVGEFS